MSATRVAKNVALFCRLQYSSKKKRFISAQNFRLMNFNIKHNHIFNFNMIRINIKALKPSKSYNWGGSRGFSEFWCYHFLSCLPRSTIVIFSPPSLSKFLIAGREQEQGQNKIDSYMYTDLHMHV